MSKILAFLNNTPEIKIAATVLIIAAVAVIIGLLLRSTRLWYWKTDKIIDAINEIGNRIDDIEEEVGGVRISAEKLMEEIRYTNAALAELGERVALLPQAKELIVGEAQAIEAPSEAEAQAGEEIEAESPFETQTKAPFETQAEAPFVAKVEAACKDEQIKEQVDDLERALRELKRQKEQLEADINSRIRD